MNGDLIVGFKGSRSLLVTFSLLALEKCTLCQCSIGKQLSTISESIPGSPEW